MKISVRINLEMISYFVFVDLSSNSSTCNYPMSQNNIENNNSNGRNQQSINNTLKYRAERTLTFENVLIGDSTLKYLDPARFDVDRKTYIKTMVSNFKSSFSKNL
jgi:hypothetical protein